MEVEEDENGKVPSSSPTESVQADRSAWSKWSRSECRTVARVQEETESTSGGVTQADATHKDAKRARAGEGEEQPHQRMTTIAWEALMSDIHEALSCAVCLKVVRDPIAAECGHVFCARCIRAYATERGYAHDHPCPVCRHPGALGSAPRLVLPISQICDIARLPCPTCAEVLPLSRLSAHECPSEEVRCGDCTVGGRTAACESRLRRGELERHRRDACSSVRCVNHPRCPFTGTLAAVEGHEAACTHYVCEERAPPAESASLLAAAHMKREADACERRRAECLALCGRAEWERRRCEAPTAQHAADVANMCAAATFYRAKAHALRERLSMYENDTDSDDEHFASEGE